MFMATVFLVTRKAKLGSEGTQVQGVLQIQLNSTSAIPTYNSKAQPDSTLRVKLTRQRTA